MKFSFPFSHKATIENYRKYYIIIQNKYFIHSFLAPRPTAGVSTHKLNLRQIGFGQKILFSIRGAKIESVAKIKILGLVQTTLGWSKIPSLATDFLTAAQ